MILSCGIAGMPNAGKSTIFNALTHLNVEVANYPFTTIDPNIGIVNVPDDRLNKIAEIIHPERVIPAALKFIDIAGLVKGASKGEGLGNRFLAHIREVDLIIHVLRCFKQDHYDESDGIDPKRDIEIVNLELLLADLQTVQKRKEKLEKLSKSINKEVEFELRVIEKLFEHISRGNPARLFPVNEEQEKTFLTDLNLLTSKPVIFVANQDEKESFDKYREILCEISEAENAETLQIYGKLESELSEFSDEEAALLLKEFNVDCPGLERLIKSSYKTLNLITFYTTNGQELRAWSIKYGTKAPKAAGIIHSDFEKGFIKAEVINYEDLITYGSDIKVKEAGLLRIEGKDYKIEDGTMVYFRYKN